MVLYVQAKPYGPRHRVGDYTINTNRGSYFKLAKTGFARFQRAFHWYLDFVEEYDLKHKIVLLKEGKKIFQMNIKPSKNSKLGDFDIILDAGKGLYFDHVILGYYFKHYKLPESKINSLSWHGYYEIIDDQQLYSPVVHIKSHGTKIDRVGHLGSINEFEPFAFPVCSLYIPNDLNINDIGNTKKDPTQCIYLDVPHLSRSARYDFFVLPKGLTIERFSDSPLMLMYRFADLEIFNNPNEGHNVVLDAEMKEYKNVGGNDIIIRIVEDPSNIEKAWESKKQIFKEESEKYSIIINDPNDIYNKLAYKPIIMFDEEGKMMKPRLLKDIHEEKIEFKPLKEIKIWD